MSVDLEKTLEEIHAIREERNTYWKERCEALNENSVHMETITKLTADLAASTKERDAYMSERCSLTLDFNAVSIENRNLKSCLSEAEWLLLTERAFSLGDEWINRRDAFLASIKKGDK